ncbi:MAG: hypothetical protein HYX88_02690 [Chloroflexi bacterium]|nr:hypothetical protein [Chloroflexota bacterium]
MKGKDEKEQHMPANEPCPPGGLTLADMKEVARMAAERGHEVVLYEKEAALGGQVLLAAKLPGRRRGSTSP